MDWIRLWFSKILNHIKIVTFLHEPQTTVIVLALVIIGLYYLSSTTTGIDYYVLEQWEYRLTIVFRSTDCTSAY